MDKFLRILGIIVVAWIAFSLIGWIVGFVVHTVFWIALIAGVVLAVGYVSNKALGGRRRSQIGTRR